MSPQSPTDDGLAARLLGLSVELCAAYLALTVALIALFTVAPSLGALSALKMLPFLGAGLWAGRRGPVPRKPKIAAMVVLAVFASVAWSAYTWATHDIGISKVATLMAASLVVMLAGSLWAYFGMYLSGRRAAARQAARERMRQ